MEKDLKLEALNKQIIVDALRDYAHDFTLFFKNIFVEEVEWTIAGHGPVAGTYYGMTELFEKAEEALFKRLAEPLVVKTIGVWVDGNEVFARIESSSVAIDGQLYNNAYMYIMTMKEGKVVSGIEWLDFNAYYDIVGRITL